jgi:AcrR family transcriptional regulator
VEALQGDIPDPFRPIERPPPAGGSNVRTERQRRQRAQILCCARELVAEEGIDNVHLLAIAARADVSVQTLYNLVGNRQEILESAVADWIAALQRTGESLARQHDTNAIFMTLEVFWASAVLYRAYNAMMVPSRAHELFLRRQFLKAGKLAVMWKLRELRTAGALVRWAEPSLIAEALAGACHTHIRDWLSNPHDEVRFRELLVNSCGLLLRGVLQGEEVARLERRF